MPQIGRARLVYSRYTIGYCSVSSHLIVGRGHDPAVREAENRQKYIYIGRGNAPPLHNSCLKGTLS